MTPVILFKDLSNVQYVYLHTYIKLLLQDLSNVDVQINVHKLLSGPRTAGGQRYATTKGGRCVPHDQNKQCVF